MANIKASLLVLDPSFFFNINYPDLPFITEIKLPQGTLAVCLLVPTSDQFEFEEEAIGINLFQKYHLERAEKSKGIESILGVTCAIFVTFEQTVDSQTLEAYRAYRAQFNRIIEQNESKAKAEKIDPERLNDDNNVAVLPSHDKEMYNICRKYLKIFLSSLRERGNVCKLKFHDYNEPDYDLYNGLFGKYDYQWKVSDAEGNIFHSIEPLPLLMEKGRYEKSRISVPLFPNEGPVKRESLINQRVWKRISEDLVAGFEPNVARTFLLDAQEEALSGNINIAIVCIAIACEIVIKRFISEEAKKIGNEFYDYVIDEAWQISVVDFLDVPLKSLVGFSLKERHGDLWKELKKIFQTRNKIVHEGKCYYLSKSGKTKKPVDFKKLIDFIESAYELFRILDS